MSQLNDILKGVKDAKAIVETKLSKQMKVWEEKMKVKQDLVTQQQQYYALVNKVEELLKKNQTLSERMDEMRMWQINCAGMVMVGFN